MTVSCPDLLGNVTRLVTESQAIVGNYAYDRWGYSESYAFRSIRTPSSVDVGHLVRSKSHSDLGWNQTCVAMQPTFCGKLGSEPG